MNKEIDISKTVLKTERFTLRPWKETDLDDFFEYAKVEGVGQMAGWLPHKSKENSKFVLDMFIREKKVFAIEYEGKVIGSLGVEKYNEERLPEFADKQGRELGFVLSKDYWGKGLMPEASKAVIKWLFEEEKLDFISCGHFVWNKQSARVQEKLGFKFHSNGVYETMYGKLEDECLNILTKEDYFSNK